MCVLKLQKGILCGRWSKRKAKFQIIYYYSDSFLFPHIIIFFYTDHAGLEIYVFSDIAWPFLRQITNVNAGPPSALESMGAKQPFRCNFFNIGLMYKQ